MFDGISMSDYILDFDLQKAYFLRDCLEEEISYELKDSNFIIYKKSDNGISEEITLDELIFYIHTEIAWECKEDRCNKNFKTGKYQFHALFKDIDTIKKAVRNMEIILKYDNGSSDEDNESDEDNGDLDVEKIEDLDVEKIEDNETLAF